MEFCNLWANLQSKFCRNCKSVIYGSVKFYGIGSQAVNECEFKTFSKQICSEARAIKRNSEDATDVNKKSNAPQEVNTSEASTEVRTEETEPIRPRSGRQIRSADEIEKIMKSVEKYAAEMASETTTTTRTTLSSTTLTSTTLTSDSNESQRSKRQQQQRQQDRPRTARVQIHNIRSSLPRPEIEMIYTVYQGNK